MKRRSIVRPHRIVFTIRERICRGIIAAHEHQPSFQSSLSTFFFPNTVDPDDQIGALDGARRAAVFGRTLHEYRLGK